MAAMRKADALTSITATGSTRPSGLIRLRRDLRTAPSSSMDESWSCHATKSAKVGSLIWPVTTSRFCIATIRCPSSNGSLGLRRRVTTSKPVAPAQMAKAIANPPTMASPGYFASIRKPRVKSSDMRGTQLSTRASRTSSLCRSTPPNAIAARRRASSTLMPARRYFSASIARWNDTSSSSSRSTASLCTSARRRFRHRVTQPMLAPASGRPEDQVYHLHPPPPALRLGAERPTAGGREAVVLRPAILIGGAPLAVQPPPLLQPL